MDEMLPQWPSTAPRCGPVVLRAFAERDVHLAFELGDDPYVPLIGSLPAKPSEQEAMDWIHRQQSKLADGAGMSFTIADARTDEAVGAIGLWLQNLAAGRATAGYSVAAGHRGRGLASSALKALTEFAWRIPALHRVELHIEPWNLGSIRVAENAGDGSDGRRAPYVGLAAYQVEDAEWFHGRESLVEDSSGRACFAATRRSAVSGGTCCSTRPSARP